MGGFKGLILLMSPSRKSDESREKSADRGHTVDTHTLLIPQRWIQRSVQRSKEVNMHTIYTWSKISLIHINTEEKVILTSE